MFRNAKNKVLFIIPATLAGAVFAVNVRGASITNGNSSLTINPSGSAPFISNWVVDGVDQYGGSPAGGEDFRIAIGSPGLIGELNSLSQTSSFNDGVASVTYTGSGFTAAVTEILTGGNPGSGASAINETIAVTNTASPGLTLDSAPPLVLTLFDVDNLNVNATPNNDTLTLSPSTGTNTATQTDPSGAQVTFNTTPTPGRFQTYDETTKTPGTSLGPVTGDEAFIAIWGMSLKAGDSEIVSINETLTGGSTSVVPLPNSASATLATLAGLGTIGIVRRLRRPGM